MRIDNPNIRFPGGFGDGKRVLLNTINITGLTVASLDILLPTQYSYQEFLIRDLRGSNDDVQLRVQVGSAETDFITDTIYDWVVHRSSLAGQAADTLEADNSWSLTETGAALGIGNGLNEGFNAEVIINNPQSSFKFPNAQWRCAFMDASTSTDVSHIRGSGQLSQIHRLDRISFILSNGNFTAGVIQHYGLTGGIHG